MNYPNFIVSYQKEESINIQRVKIASDFEAPHYRQTYGWRAQSFTNTIKYKISPEYIHIL